MKTDFDYNSMPVSFAHCLNGHCLRADKCLRRQVTLGQSENPVDMLC